MGDTSGIFHILLLLYIYYRTYVGVCVTPFFFFFGVRCAQYKVHAQCSFAALAPHMPCMLLVIHKSIKTLLYCNAERKFVACQVVTSIQVTMGRHQFTTNFYNSH